MVPIVESGRFFRRTIVPGGARRFTVARFALGAGLLALGTAAAAPARALPPAETVRGVTISTHTDGGDWASEGMATTIADIKAVGAQWVAIHPYAWIRPDGRVQFHEFDPADPPDYLVRPIREAHALGMKILIKPHLGYWGSGFAWRGEIHFETGDQWVRFFTGYERWIALVAEACREADGFVVGTELDRTLAFEDEWRAIVAAVRARTDAPLTYGANWTDYRRVPFWDALDVIGIQAYFPLTDAASPDSAAVAAGWSRLMAELRGYAEEHNRNILFTELGYNRSFDAPSRPWDYRVDGEDAERVQQLCLSEALRAVDDEPCVVGVFLWKWFPNPRPVGRNFQLATPRLRRTIAEAWGE